MYTHTSWQVAGRRSRSPWRAPRTKSRRLRPAEAPPSLILIQTLILILYDNSMYYLCCTGLYNAMLRYAMLYYATLLYYARLCYDIL